jgi:hypothetical protein
VESPCLELLSLLQIQEILKTIMIFVCHVEHGETSDCSSIAASAGTCHWQGAAQAFYRSEALCTRIIL